MQVAVQDVASSLEVMAKLKSKDRARHRRLVRHRRSHGRAARASRLQGLRHQQTGRPGGQAIVRDAAARRDQR